MTRHWLELASQWLEVNRQFSWLNSDSTRPSHDYDSTRKNFSWLWLDSDSRALWLWLDKNHSDTSLVFCRYYFLHIICKLAVNLQDFIIVWQNTSCTVWRPAVDCLPHWCCWTVLPGGVIQLNFLQKWCNFQWCSRDRNLRDRDRDLAQISRRDRDFVIKAETKTETETWKFETETRDLTFLWW